MKRLFFLTAKLQKAAYFKLEPALRFKFESNGRAIGAKLILFAMLVSVIAAFSAPANETTETTRRFLDGVQHYNDGNYSEAADAFKKITADGVRNGKLYYNLGNACFKSGDIGRAILWYERAAKLVPHDPDLKFNLNYARTFIKDKNEGKKKSVFGLLFFWRELMGRGAVQWTGLAFNLLLWGCLGTRLFRRKAQGRLKTAAVCLTTVAGIFLATAAYDYYAASAASAGGREAVILPQSVSVRSGLSESSTELFILHAGTKVMIDNQKNGYYRIRFSEDKIGWICGDKAGVIES